MVIGLVDHSARLSFSLSLKVARGLQKIFNPELFSGFLYMTFWLLFSIAFVLLDIQTGAEFWAISFIPAAYFFSGFLKKIKSDFLKNILFTVVFSGIVLFKLHDYGIISLELPFEN